MKVNGEEFEGGAIYGPVAIKRGNKLFGFYAQPCWSFDEFNRLCPEPEAPVKRFNAKTGKKERDPRDPQYKQDVEEYYNKRWGYIVLTSLQPSDIELDGVSLDDPSTWGKVEEALRYSEDNPNGLSENELGRVMALVSEANMLDDAKVEASVDSFLQNQGLLEKSENGPIGEAQN